MAKRFRDCFTNDGRTDYGRPMKLFFKDISNFWANWPNRLNKFWGICIFGLTKYQHPFGHCRSLLYDFYHSDVFSAKPITQIYHKYDIGHKNLRNGHHMSAFGDVILPIRKFFGILYDLERFVLFFVVCFLVQLKKVF